MLCRPIATHDRGHGCLYQRGLRVGVHAHADCEELHSAWTKRTRELTTPSCRRSCPRGLRGVTLSLDQADKRGHASSSRCSCPRGLRGVTLSLDQADKRSHASSSRCSVTLSLAQADKNMKYKDHDKNDLATCVHLHAIRQTIS